jgi:hypothetical protein
VRRYFVITQGI